MTAYLFAAAGLVASLLPLGVVCARGRPIEGAIALQLAGVTIVLAMLCIGAASVNTTYVVVPVIAAVLLPVSGLIVARMLGHRV